MSLQACASSQRAVGADAAVDDSSALTAAGCEEQSKARKRASSVKLLLFAKFAVISGLATF